MSYYIDPRLQKGIDLVKEGKKVNTGLTLINESCKSGTTKGKSYFEAASILRNGIPGMAPNIDLSRKFYDQAMFYFRNSKCDSMDYREMGDYYYYQLGTEDADINRALEYYELAEKDGDELAHDKAEEIRRLKAGGSASTAPVLTPETEVQEVTPIEEVVEVEVPAEAPVEEVEETVAEEPAEEKVEAVVTPAPVVSLDSKLYAEDDEDTKAVIDAEQILIKAIRLLDSDASTAQDKLDGVELARNAAEANSLRANVLMGYLYEGEHDIVEGDYDEAKKYYEKAIELGSATALFRLGLLHLEEEAEYYNVEKGHELIVLSARKGYAPALAYIGDAFRVKVDDERNLSLAYRYFALAGERGLGTAYHNMAEIDASRQDMGLSRMHEEMANARGYDPEKGFQEPLFTTIHA